MMIKIYGDTLGKAACRSCHAPITWAETINGKKMPFDGELVAVTTERQASDNRPIWMVDTTVSPSHFVTCPQAKDWRRR